MKDRVIVTGGAGYIGSHACKALSRAGYDPVSYDDLSRGNAWAVKWGPFEQGGIADKARLLQVFRQYEPVAVVHFAAFCYVGESVAEPALYYGNNVGGSIALVEAMLDAGIDKLVLSSTCAVYGDPERLPITESHPQRPTSPYGMSKLMVEQMLRSCEDAYGLRSVSLRYFNAAGADPEGEIGECHRPETRIIPLAMAAALGRRPALDIYGTDYDTPDGTAVRDYVHVADLAEAHVAALQYLRSGGRALAANLGTGKGHSVLEVIRMVERECARKVPVNYAPRRPGDPPIMIAEAEKAEALLGWRPQYPDLETIVRTAWKWHTRQVVEETC